MLFALLLQLTVDDLVARLGHDDPDVREASEAALLKWGDSAEPSLRRAFIVEIETREAWDIDDNAAPGFPLAWIPAAPLP